MGWHWHYEPVRSVAIIVFCSPKRPPPGIKEDRQTVSFQWQWFKRRETRRDSITICGRKLGRPQRISIIRFSTTTTAAAGIDDGPTDQYPLKPTSRSENSASCATTRAVYRHYTVTKLSQRIDQPWTNPRDGHYYWAHDSIRLHKVAASQVEFSVR